MIHSSYSKRFTNDSDLRTCLHSDLTWGFYLWILLNLDMIQIKLHVYLPFHGIRFHNYENYQTEAW